MFPCDEGVMVNNGDSITNMDILINHFCDLDVSDVDISDIDTVWAMITMTVVYFSRSQWNPYM